MCGIAGYFTNDNHSHHEWIGLMTDTILHRGPDDSGAWFDDKSGISLGHRRLSILDLSSSGHQPMESTHGRFMTVFNGEIYNFKELRDELQPFNYHWKGHSDTEIILAGFEVWGIEETLQKMVGMFAIAIWDKETNELILARDRMGEKPLYYGWQKNSFLFGSELKSLKAHPHFEHKIDREALALYFRYGYVPAPLSIYKGVYKLKPGSLIRLNTNGKNNKIVEPKLYWSFEQIINNGIKDPFNGSDLEAVDKLEKLLTNSVSLQRVADVPLGAFLSGGVDSTTVVALMQKQSAVPIKTFTIGFGEKEYNEAIHAKAVSKYLGTEHTELYVTPEESRHIIPMLPNMYDEPFGDVSAIPTYLVSQLARQQVTVSLSGDAGDELFGGYGHHIRDSAIWNKIDNYPKGLRIPAGSILQGLGKIKESPTLNTISKTRNRMYHLGGLMGHKQLYDYFEQRRSIWPNADELLKHSVKSPNIMKRYMTEFGLETANSMMVADSQTYLPDDILVKVDRAAMSVSLETRVPMLDHRVVEFAFSLPLKYKIRNGKGKWILKEVLYRHVPKELIDRPKMGFGVPIGQWMKGPLKQWTEDLLAPEKIVKEGFLDPNIVSHTLKMHMTGDANYEYRLWLLLNFESWLANNPEVN